MNEFLEILLIGATIAGVVTSIALGRRIRLRRQRILVEDALKHLYHCEYSRLPCTVNSLAGAMGRKADLTAKVVAEMTDRNLVFARGPEFHLTDPGREYALSVIRTHRLWERYLADETMVGELDWHKQAELKEHTLTSDEVESLSKRLGHPVYDPHGDPIPSPSGQIPRQRGSGVESFKAGEVVRIVHVEDEPPSVYAELVRAGLYPGMDVVVIDPDGPTVVLEREGERLELSPLVAANLRVRKVVEDGSTGPRKTMGSLAPGARAVVTELSPACRGLQRRRLMDLGIVPGTTVAAEMRSPGGDPTAYRIRGATIALRKEHANLVFIEDES